MRISQPHHRVANASSSKPQTNGRKAEVKKLLDVLPPRFVESLETAGVAEEDVVEIVLDYGRKPLTRARSGGGQRNQRRGIDVTLSVDPVSRYAFRLGL